MRRYSFFRLLLAGCFLLGGVLPVWADNTPPLFLLGRNEKLEVVRAGGDHTLLELGKNPLELITGSAGEKLVLCGGEIKKNGQIIQPASLKRLNAGFTAFENSLSCDSALVLYEKDLDRGVVWLGTRGGWNDKDPVAAKLYQIRLADFAVTEFVLDSIPVEMALSQDGKWLAVATLGTAEEITSRLWMIDREKVSVVAKLEAFKNPGWLEFTPDSATVMVAGYGYDDGEEAFKIPRTYFSETLQPVKPGVLAVHLGDSTVESVQIPLERISQDYILGRDGRVYAISAQEESGRIIAINENGVCWEHELDFAPVTLQKRPDRSQLYITGGQRLRIMDRTTGETLKDLNSKSGFKSILFLKDSPIAYSYHPGLRKLNILNLDTLELVEEATVASGGRAALKIMVAVASVASFNDSLKPQYMGGVRMPQSTPHIYWFRNSGGDMVAGPEAKKLFIISPTTSQVVIFDTVQRKTIEKITVGEESKYLMLTPNQKFMIVVAGDTWRIINTDTNKVTLKISVDGLKFQLAFAETSAPTPYLNPAGDRLYVPVGSKVKVTDLTTGKKLKDISSKTKEPLIYW